MKIAVISDIHGNLENLNKVLKTIENLRVDKIICLGDIVGSSFHNKEVIDKLLKLDNLYCVRGNREDFIKFHFLKHNLVKKDMQYIENLKKEDIITIGKFKIYFSHYPLNMKKGYKKHIKVPNLEDFKKLYDYIDADIYLYGHTHTKNIVIDNILNKYYINPGTVGVFEKQENPLFIVLEFDEEKDILDLKINEIKAI